MILYTLIVRSKDGLALSASTDFNDEGLRDVKESKKYLKILAKKTYQFPDRCILNTGNHTIFLLTALGVSYLALTDLAYPTVLGFSFLNELMKEFLGKYLALTVNQARRPYSFIEFNNTIHSARQRYNKPQSLSTRINLSELSEEIRLRPPHTIKLGEVKPLNGFHTINVSKATVGPPLRLEPVSWFGYGITLIAVLLSLIDILRGVAASNSSFDDFDGPGVAFHSFVFGTEAVVRLLQVIIYLDGGKRNLKFMWISVAVLLLSGASVYDLRDRWQNGLRLFVTGALVYLTLCRKHELRLPDYNV
ncbi:Vesicle-trafficking protein SEC22a [Frankliniella fusca]|uniref:Vesicle-trafficking protein SEC22a n=1 Tax=Frankliniella fusca TaxID=407009 RepID=A0AAE1L6U7_9NEOP|nr:Vesicle-trafficking protein SEC22a [Frankliniella fusca]